jgi:hypothetical protein
MQQMHKYKEQFAYQKTAKAIAMVTVNIVKLLANINNSLNIAWNLIQFISNFIKCSI